MQAGQNKRATAWANGGAKTQTESIESVMLCKRSGVAFR